METKIAVRLMYGDFATNIYEFLCEESTEELQASLTRGKFWNAFSYDIVQMILDDRLIAQGESSLRL